MKIKSTKDYFGAGYGYGLVVFKGSGTSDGADTDTAKIYPLHDAVISFIKDKVPNYLVMVTTPTGVLTINLQDDNDQAGWLNTEAGKDACIKDLILWANEAKGISSGSMTVGGEVEVSNFPATQPVSGTVSVSNFPDTAASFDKFSHVKTFDGATGRLTREKLYNGAALVVTYDFTYDADGNELTKTPTIA